MGFVERPGMSRQKVQKVSRRCPEGVQKMFRRCPEGWKRMWERLEGPLQVCRRPQVFYRRSHSVRLSRRSHVSQRVASTSEQPSQSWALKSRHCGLLVKACGPSGHSGHLLKLAKAPSGHLLKLAPLVARSVTPPSPSGRGGTTTASAACTSILYRVCYDPPQ